LTFVALPIFLANALRHLLPYVAATCVTMVRVLIATSRLSLAAAVEVCYTSLGAYFTIVRRHISVSRLIAHTHTHVQNQSPQHNRSMWTAILYCLTVSLLYV